MFKTLKLASLAAVLALGVAQAEAATVRTIKEPNSFVGLDLTKSTTVTGGTLADLVNPNGLSIQTASVDGQYRSPFQGTAANGTSYFNLAQHNTATYTLTSVQTVFSMLWGSVDSHNALKFYNGASLVATVLNTALTNPDTATNGSGAAFVTVSDLMFDKVEFISSGTAFEFSNIAAVPLPAGMLLLATAVGGFAVARRLRKAA